MTRIAVIIDIKPSFWDNLCELLGPPERNRCKGDFTYFRQAARMNGYSDDSIHFAIHCLQRIGACCDCEAVLNVMCKDDDDGEFRGVLGLDSEE